MKTVTTLLLVTFSFFTASAQELEIVNQLQVTPITTETISVQILKDAPLSFIKDENSIAKKKSYKRIIENTLSGRKNLIFKPKRSIKTC